MRLTLNTINLRELLQKFKDTKTKLLACREHWMLLSNCHMKKCKTCTVTIM